MEHPDLGKCVSDLLNAENIRKPFFIFDFEDIQSVPITAGNILKEEANPVIGYAHGGRRPFAYVAPMEKIILQFLLGNLLRCFVVESGKQTNRTHIALPGFIAFAGQLQGSVCFFVPICHHDHSPVYGLKITALTSGPIRI